MWPGWHQLERASMMADLPPDALPITFAAVQMLFASDLQWERLQATLDAPHGSLPINAAWVIDAHFFLVAADNARDRLSIWADALDDDEARGLAARLDNSDVKEFRHHQEHLEERMPGGKHAEMARLSAPGNAMIRIEAGGGVTAMNSLSNRRLLSFGQGEVDLLAAHTTVIEVVGDLLRWLQARSRFQGSSR